MDAVSNIVSRIHQPLFDTTEYTGGAAITELDFFLLNKGSALPISGGVKNIRHTNMVQAGSLPAKQRFTIMSINLKLQYAVDATDDMTDVFAAILSEATLQLVVSDKVMLEIPATMAGAGGGMNLVSAGAAATTLAVNNGIPSREARFPLAEPIVLTEKESFQVKLFVTGTIPSGGAIASTHQVVCVLDGIMERNVN